MIGLSRAIKNNWPYVFMVVFFGLIVISMSVSERGVKVKDAAEEERIVIEPFNKENFIRQQRNVERMMEENKPLHLFVLAFNLILFIILMGGITLNIYIIYAGFIKKRDILERTRDLVDIKWDISDVIRFVILFYCFGFLFLSAEETVLKAFPDMYGENFKYIMNAMVMDLAGILFVLYFVGSIHGQDIRAIGLTGKKIFKNIVYGISGYIAVIPTLLITLLLTALFVALFKVRAPVQPLVDMMVKEDNVHILLYSSIFAAVAGPVMEEIFFRGFMYAALRKRVGVLWAIMISSLIFSMLHAHLIGFLPIMILGMLLAYLYERTGSLTASITLHILHNLASLIMVFFMKGINQW